MLQLAGCRRVRCSGVSAMVALRAVVSPPQAIYLDRLLTQWEDAAEPKRLGPNKCHRSMSLGKL